MNAVQAEQNEAIGTLRQAEAALETGDLRFAGILADEAAQQSPDLALAATRIHAAATARDPASTEAQLEAARIPAGAISWQTERSLEIDARIPARREAALRGLRDLQEKDLIGSAWAIAALARLEVPEKRAALLETCRVRAVDPDRACRAELGAPPVTYFHGAPATYVTGGALFVGLLLVLLVRTRERRPWRGHLLRVQLAAAVAGLGVVIGFARTPFSAIAAMVVLYAAVLLVERRLFFRAVRGGRVKGLGLRPVVDADEDLVTCVVNGPKRDEVLERVAEKNGYRDSARGEPIYRIIHRPQKMRTVTLVAVGVVFGLVVAVTMLFFTARSGPVPHTAASLDPAPLQM